MELKVSEVPNVYDKVKDYLEFNDKSTKLNNQVFLNVDRIQHYLTHFNILKDQWNEEFNQCCFEECGEYHVFDLSKRIHVKNALTQILGIPVTEINYQGKFSLRGDVLERLFSKYRHPAIKALMTYNEYKSKIQNLNQFHEYCYGESKLISNEGDKLKPIRPQYEPLVTKRFQTHGPNFQGIMRELSDIISAPKGWLILQVDSKQIEPTIYISLILKDPLIMWLVNEWQDVYLALADYCLRPNIDYIESNLYKYESFDKKHRSTLKTLVNAGTYGSSLKYLRYLSSSIYDKYYFSTEEGKSVEGILKKIPYYKKIIDNPSTSEGDKHRLTQLIDNTQQMVKNAREASYELSDRFYERFLNHPMRLSFEKEVERKISRGETKVYSPFGDKRVVFGDYNYVRNCFYNNPNQMTAARLSSLSINKAFEYIMSHDALKQGLIYGMNVHDEDVFVVQKNLVPYVKEYLASLREYKVEGWLPIYSSLKVGLDYDKS